MCGCAVGPVEDRGRQKGGQGRKKDQSCREARLPGNRGYTEEGGVPGKGVFLLRDVCGRKEVVLVKFLGGESEKIVSDVYYKIREGEVL